MGSNPHQNLKMKNYNTPKSNIASGNDGTDIISFQDSLLRMLTKDTYNNLRVSKTFQKFQFYYLAMKLTSQTDQIKLGATNERGNTVIFQKYSKMTFKVITIKLDLLGALLS